MQIRVLVVCIVGALLFLTGCQNALYKPTGEVMVSYSENKAVPYVLSMPDIAMGCALGQSFSPFMQSFEETGVDVSKVAILMNTLSGFCADQQAAEQELRQLRAIAQGQAAEARDALIAQKRFDAIAAKREYDGYLRMIEIFGEPESDCPAFKSDTDEFYYLIGLINGLHASQNNIAASQTSNVPMSVVNKVGRGAECLEPEKWWGVPLAIKATVWSMLPSNAPKDSNPRELLKQASDMGVKQGVRLSFVFEAEVYKAASDVAGLKRVIHRHSAVVVKNPADEKFRMLDSMAEFYLEFLSDRLWTEAKGYRTPVGQYGQFWQEKPKQAAPEIDIDIDDLI